MAKSKENGIRSVRNALRISRYLNACQEPVGANRIAIDLGINASSCFRLLKTLTSECVLVFNERSKKYSPAMGLIELARGALYRLEYKILRTEIEELSKKFDTTTVVMFPVGRERAIITDVVERDSPLRFKIDVGQDFQLFVGAFGRCFAACSDLTKDALRTEFEKTQWEDAPSFEDYFAQVEQAKKDGFAIDMGNHIRGVVKVSTCVQGPDGRPRFALSILAFATRFSKKECRQIGLDLKHRAELLEANDAMRSMIGIGR